MQVDRRPLVLHVMYRFDTGGLENGVVNLINHMPGEAFRHAVLALTEITDFRERIKRSDVDYIGLAKPPGQGFWQYPKLFSLFRKLRPSIVHTRNLAALEAQLPAWAAGVPVRVHGEHGRDVGDLDGSNVTMQRVRLVYRPFVHHYMALSLDLAEYVHTKVRVAPSDITQAYNGVDTDHFSPGIGGQQPIEGCPFHSERHFLVGTVGRMQTAKDQPMLARAFVQALAQAPELATRLRLVMVGGGPLLAEVREVMEGAGLLHLAWLPGERNDVAQVMRGLNLFALPSLAEGISNTILEAMACGLPVVATAVGGNADLVQHGKTGFIVPPADPKNMALRLVELAQNSELARMMGAAGRARVTAAFGMHSMVKTYQDVYESQLQRRHGHLAFPT